MSKMDNLRAMREAKYAEAQKRASAAPTKSAVRPPVAPRAAAAKSQAEPDAAAASPDTDELCGHRNMSGRTCTRERGHAAKSHRYS
jgi:hypothetical protein